VGTLCPGLTVHDTHEPKSAKLSIMLRGAGLVTVEATNYEIRPIVISALRQLGFRHCPGAAPPGHNEDTLVQLLNALQGEAL
jgi:hypothetical protein